MPPTSYAGESILQTDWQNYPGSFSLKVKTAQAWCTLFTYFPAKIHFNFIFEPLTKNWPLGDVHSSWAGRFCSVAGNNNWQIAINPWSCFGHHTFDLSCSDFLLIILLTTNFHFWRDLYTFTESWGERHWLIPLILTRNRSKSTAEGQKVSYSKWSQVPHNVLQEIEDSVIKEYQGLIKCYIHFPGKYMGHLFEQANTKSAVDRQMDWHSDCYV